jgi:rSAM/selenodomain-associated transferase 2/rSAM/selenodomain-associated transferase 1
LTPTPRLSVVIPALDESETISDLLGDLRALSALIPIEVVVVDGGSTDSTRAQALASGAAVVPSATGRGIQLRAGADAAVGEWLLFLHADSRLEASALDEVARFVSAAPSSEFAHFALQYEGRGPFLRAIEIGQRVRERLFGLVYGDQGLLVSRTLYDMSGGYPIWPIMEDVGLVDRLQSAGRRTVLSATIRTSPRRYEEEGAIRAWLRNLRLITRFRLGASPSVLAEDYAPRRASHHHPTRHHETEIHTVAIFVKEPIAGRVKTRLAAAIGDDEALRIYTTIASQTVRELARGPWRLVVFVDPPEAESLVAVREWLGSDLDVRPQQPSDLGGRMAAAIAECLLDSKAACVVGSDIPGITVETMRDAFQRLGSADVVFGPATDGGYYLAGMSRSHPSLFAGIAWSTDRVLKDSLTRAEEAGLLVSLLSAKTDVDTLPDVPSELLTA